MSYRAAYYGPETSAATPATVMLERDSLVIHPDGAGKPVLWPRDSLRIDDGSVAGGPLRVSSPAGSGLLMISDPELQGLLGVHRQSGASALAKGLLLIGAFAVASILAGYYLFLPWIAGVMARRIPASFEQRLGRTALDQLAPVAQRCEDESVRKPVRAIVDKLARYAPKMDYSFQVYIVKDKTVNALATPGGYIVVYTGLLEKTKTPEELAAILAHEMTHVTAHHGTVGIMRAMTFWVMLSYLIGDPSGILVQAAGALSQLSYQRGQEEEADRGAMRLFEEARIDPQGLEDSFKMLSQELPDLPASARYFSTHPRTEDRLADIRDWERKVNYRPRPLLDGSLAWPPRGCLP